MPSPVALSQTDISGLFLSFNLRSLQPQCCSGGSREIFVRNVKCLEEINGSDLGLRLPGACLHWWRRGGIEEEEENAGGKVKWKLFFFFFLYFVCFFCLIRKDFPLLSLSPSSGRNALQLKIGGQASNVSSQVDSFISKCSLILKRRWLCVKVWKWTTRHSAAA